MTEENEDAAERPGVLNIGVTRYAQPLRPTDVKKLARLRELAELHVVGFSDCVRYLRVHDPAELYLVPLLPLAALRFCVLFGFALVLGLRLAWKGGLDIVLSQSPYEGLVGILVRTIAGWFGTRVAVITEVHGDWSESPFLYRRIPFARPVRAVLGVWAAFVLRRSDAVRTISTFLQSKLHDVAPDVPVRRFPGYTDFELFRSGARKSGDHGPLIAVGGLYPVKGFQHLVRSLERVVKEKPDTVLDIVGEGPLRGDLEELAQREGVARHVRFVGGVHQHELAKLYREASVLVAPSLSEGLGRVVWEAMACALPVVASDVGGIPDLITDGETGFLVPPGDEQALAERILFVLRHPDEARKMGARARDSVRDRFSTERYADGYRELFEAVSRRSSQV